MNMKLLGIAALAASLALPTFAFAEDATAPLTKDHTTTEATGTPATDGDFFTSPDASGFYTDNTMGTMRSKEEMKMAYDKMTPDAQAKMKVACGAATDQKYSDMCEGANAM